MCTLLSGWRGLLTGGGASADATRGGLDGRRAAAADGADD